MTTFRRRIGNAFVTATRQDSGEWQVAVTDTFYQPVSDEVRRTALDAVLAEISSLRTHIYHDELGNPRPSRAHRPATKR